MDPGLIWIFAGLLLLLSELVLPGVFLLWIGLAAIGAGLTVLTVAPGLGTAVPVFIVLLGLGLWAGLTLRRRTGARATDLNQPGSGLIGRTGTLLPAPGPGVRVRIGDSDWPARLPDDTRVPEAPIAVRVEGVEGTTLLVRPVAP